MKKIFNLIAAAAIIAGFASCQPKSEDAFSTDPVAPELYAHNDILLTTGTPDEDVTFAWSAYRNLPKGLPYTFTAAFGEDEVELANTEELYSPTERLSMLPLLSPSTSMSTVMPSLPSLHSSWSPSSSTRPRRLRR